MSARRTPLPAALLAVVVVAAAAGCGAGAARGGAGAAGGGGGRAAVAVLAPAPGAIVEARPRGGRLALRLEVRGTAAAGARLAVVGSGCAVPCGAEAVADGGGAWHATVAMTLPADAARASVTAAYAPARPGDAPAVTTVLLSVPRAPAVPARPGAAGRRAAGAPRTAATEEEGPGGASGGARTLVLIGDSLSLGQQPLLEAELPGWSIGSSAAIGRHLAEGMRILAGAALPPRGVVAIGLFTNDDPWRTGALEAGVRESLRRAGPDGCAIWATIASPPVEGRTFGAANRLLGVLALQEPRLRLVPWAEAVARQPSLVGGDGVHPVPAGERLRAQLFAQAARSCP